MDNVTLILTREQAIALHKVLGGVGGDRNTTRRALTDPIYDLLDEACMPDSLFPAEDTIGDIEFI